MARVRLARFIHFRERINMKMFPIVQVGDSDSVVLVAMFASKEDAQGFLDYVEDGWTDYLRSSLMLLEELPLTLDTSDIEFQQSTREY